MTIFLHLGHIDLAAEEMVHVTILLSGVTCSVIYISAAEAAVLLHVLHITIHLTPPCCQHRQGIRRFTTVMKGK
jgi:hypothetical protein